MFNLFKGKRQPNKETKPVTFETSLEYKPSVTNQCFEIEHNPEFDPIVLYWLAGKKNGFDHKEKSAPKWFKGKYGIDFNDVAYEYLGRGFIEENDKGMWTVSSSGLEFLKEMDYIVYIHEHSYGLLPSDFTESKMFKKVSNNDIAWGIFNNRILEYSSKRQWHDLELNYSNMAELLIEEKKYRNALEFIFASAFIETSGMQNNNELKNVMQRFNGKRYEDGVLPNGMPDIFMMEINNYIVTAPFLKAQEELNYDWGTVKNLFYNSVTRKSLENLLPFRYFEKEESFEFLKEAVLSGERGGVFPLSKVSKKLKWNKPDVHSNDYLYTSTENLVAMKMNKR